MKGLIFTTGTPDTIKLVRSFTSLGHEHSIVQYDVPGISVEQMARQYQPEVIVYIGAIRRIHHSPVPDTAELCRTNAIAPMIHICSDAADPPWWPDLEEYHAAGAFRLQVSIDGTHDCPMSKVGMVALTPVMPELFPESHPDWNTRPHICGFSGGVGFRDPLLAPVRHVGKLTHFGNGGHAAPYEELCRFYTTCKTVLNDPRTGSGEKNHMKGRFMEAAAGGAVVIENRNSPAKDWFVPGEDFLVWDTPLDALYHVEQLTPAYEEIGKRLRAKVLEQHSAQAFWTKIFKAANIG